MKCSVVVHKNILADDMGCIEIMTFVNKKSCPEGSSSKIMRVRLIRRNYYYPSNGCRVIL